MSKRMPILSKSLAEEILEDCNKLIEFIMSKLRENPEYDIELICRQLGTSRITLWRKLGRCGTTFEELKKKAREEAKERAKAMEMKLMMKLEKKRIPPQTRKEFMERKVVRDLDEKLRAQIGISISKSQYQKIISTFWDIIDTYNTWVRGKKLAGDPRAEELYEITPEDITDPEIPKEEKYKWILKYLEIKRDLGRNINSIIANIQSLQMHLDVRLLPPAIKQPEYTGKYSGAYLPKEVIESVLLDLAKLYRQTGREFYRQSVKAILFLLETGSRRESLSNFKVINRNFKIRNRIIQELYGEDTFVVVQTEEKGKRGRKFTWEKFIRKSVEDLAIPDHIFSPKDVTKLSNIFKQIVLKYADKLNDATKMYLVKATRSLHVLRHTSAYTFLIASNYNMFLVSKLLGWKKSDNLKIYANPTLLEIAQIDASTITRVEFISKEVADKLRALLK
jgi:transposase-like protein